jgi:putative peptidoglycan lipid II flippase
MGVVLWVSAGGSAEWLAAGAAERVARLTLVIAAGGFSYFAALWLLGFRLKDFNHRVVS